MRTGRANGGWTPQNALARPTLNLSQNFSKFQIGPPLARRLLYPRTHMETATAATAAQPANPLAQLIEAVGGPAKYMEYAAKFAPQSLPPIVVNAEHQPLKPSEQIKVLFKQGKTIREIADALGQRPDDVLAIGVSTGQIDPLELETADYKRMILSGLIQQATQATEASVKLKALAQLRDIQLVSEEVRYRHERVNDDVKNRIVIVTEAIEKARQKSLAAVEESRQLPETSAN